MRDFDANPYSSDEERVAKWLCERSPNSGAGDDPIGFVLASLAFAVFERNMAQDELARLSVSS